VPVVRSGIARRHQRTVALGALLVTVAVLALVLTSGGGSQRYQVILQNAGLLVHGDLVRVGGVQAGQVESLALTDDGRAAVTLSLDQRYTPLHAGTTVTLARSLRRGATIAGAGPLRATPRPQARTPRRTCSRAVLMMRRNEASRQCVTRDSGDSLGVPTKCRDGGGRRRRCHDPSVSLSHMSNPLTCDRAR